MNLVGWGRLMTIKPHSSQNYPQTGKQTKWKPPSLPSLPSPLLPSLPFFLSLPHTTSTIQHLMATSMTYQAESYQRHLCMQCRRLAWEVFIPITSWELLHGYRFKRCASPDNVLEVRHLSRQWPQAVYVCWEVYGLGTKYNEFSTQVTRKMESIAVSRLAHLARTDIHPWGNSISVRATPKTSTTTCCYVPDAKH